MHGDPHGRGASGAAAAQASSGSTPAPFSARLKDTTWAAHQEAEEHGFTQALLDGGLDRAAYADMVAQHYFAYVPLEEAGRALAGDPVAGPFVLPELERVPALRADLAYLLGPEWADRIAPSTPTEEYAARLRASAADPAAFVAHHYTRYMGDVSGGQFIRRTAARTYAFPGTDGTAFYDFSALGSLPAFKNRYRERLDAVPAAHHDRILTETAAAYRLNTDVLADLGRRHTATRAA